MVKTMLPMALMRGLTCPCEHGEDADRQRLVEAGDEPGDGVFVEGDRHGDEQGGRGSPAA